MLVIENNTEQELYKKLKTCWETLPTHRCLHLRLSQIEQDINEWFLELVNELRTYLDDQTAQIYLCHDQDVFLITRAMTKKRADDFLTQLPPKLAPVPLQGLASLFEIGVDWPHLRRLCEKKITDLALKKAQEEQKKEKQAEVAKVNREAVLKTLDQSLVKSLAKRRAMRENPEIMVVEDDPFSQKLIKNALKSRYTPSITGDGQGALMSYVSKAPDVLFLDIGLPDIDGHEVLEKLFEIDPDAYVVMFSGNGDKDNIMKAIGLGAKGFVGKPFTQEKLFQYIEKSPFIQAKQK